MSRRKHVLQSLEQDVEPPAEGQHIVRALGSRGSNIIEVEFPDGRSTLCLLPAKFHKKLWIKKGTYLIVDDVADADSRVTGQILAVLYAEHVKQLKRMPGIWPLEFDSGGAAAGVQQAAQQLAALGVAESDSDPEGSSTARQEAAEAGADPAAGPSDPSRSAAAVTDVHAAVGGQAAGDDAAGGEAGEGEDAHSSSDDDLPPIPKFNNRKVIEYEVSDSDSEED